MPFPHALVYRENAIRLVINKLDGCLEADHGMRCIVHAAYWPSLLIARRYRTSKVLQMLKGIPIAHDSRTLIYSRAPTCGRIRRRHA